MCRLLSEAEKLVNLSEQKQLVLQVGHLERFNPAVGVLKEYLNNPRFIECERLAPFKKRGTDVNVVLDMMIHDIDLVLHLAASPIKSIEAIGYPLMSDEEDMAKAWIVFENGCLATITASRVNPKVERIMRVFQEGAYMTLDLGHNSFVMTEQKLKGEAELEWRGIEKTFSKTDNLQLEADSFARSISEGITPVVTGMDGLLALDASLKINKSFSKIRSGLEG
jgi:predicted dehydrogenase